VPALEARPECPLWLVPALDAWSDLGGSVEWLPVREWSARYGINLEWLLPVLRHAARMVDEHQTKLRKQKRASTARSQTDPGH
jgi:hypothetical protein